MVDVSPWIFFLAAQVQSDWGNTGFDAKKSFSVNLGYSFLDSHRLGVMLNSTEIDKVGTPNYLSANDLDDYRDSDYKAIDFTYTGETSDHFLGWELRYFETEIFN